MKKYIFTILLFAPALLRAQTNYTLKGDIGHLNSPAKAYLLYPSAMGNRIDSATVKDGKFEFKGTTYDGVKAIVLLAHKGEQPRMLKAPDHLALFLESATITSADSLVHATITNSQLNGDSQELTAITQLYADQVTAARAAYMALPGDQRSWQRYDELQKKESSIDEAKKAALATFIKSHPKSLISLDALVAYGGYYPEAGSVAPLYDGLSLKIRASAAGQQYGQLLDNLKLTALGVIAPQFKQNDKDGNTISLASFKGKYVLVDFWASWCGPCRRENPNVVKAYNRFKGQNFTILGVSLDAKRDAWLKAIADDQLDWTQVSDLQYWKNEVAVKYGVKAIPQNFLLDPTGKIIAKNLSGNQLSAKLDELFPNQAGVNTDHAGNGVVGGQ